jgi:hypothetical protein
MRVGAEPGRGSMGELRESCGKTASWKEDFGARSEIRPPLQAEVRNRGLEWVTKSGVSIQYLGLRVAPSASRVNPFAMFF